MCNLHGVIIYHIGKIICGKTVRFYQDHIIQLGILHRNVSVQFIMKRSCSFLRIVLSDDKRLSDRQIRLCLLLRQGQTVLIIHRNLLALHNLRPQGRKPVFIAEAIIGFSLFN